MDAVDTDVEGKVHRALADARRAQLVDELSRAPKGLDVQQLTERLGLHPNTIRWHLAVLSDASIVRSRPVGRSTPGRPRIVYTLDDRTDARDAGSFRLLATMFVGALSGLRDGEEKTEDAGREFGRHLVKRPSGPRIADEVASAEIVELLAQQGFRPELEGEELRMHHCPFGELAPGVVCAAHLGVVAGALEGLGSRLEITDLEAFVEPDLCIAKLRRPEPRDRTVRRSFA